MVRERISIVLCIAGCLLLIAMPAAAQVADTLQHQVEEDIERALEDFDDEETDLDPEEFVQYLQDLAANPLNINRATFDELEQIPGMNSRLARAIIEHRRQQPFESVDDLTDVQGIGPATLDRFRPYIRVGGTAELFRDMITTPRYWVQNSRFEVITRYQSILEDQAGYIVEDPDQTRYLGDQGRYYQRFNYRSNYLSLNLTQTKNAGEQIEGSTGFPFTSGHFSVRNVGLIQQIVIGDFGLFFGQGLTLWTGMAFGKGREIRRAAYRTERGVRPFQSSDRFNYQRGAAFTIGETLQLSGFYSNRPHSASIIEGDSVRFPTRAPQFRTTSELDRKNNINKELYGGRLLFRSDYGQIGVTGYRTEFDHYIVRGGGLHQQYDFEGYSTSGLGADFRLFLGDLIWFGEFSRSENGGWGMVSGLDYPLGDQTDISFAYRNYQQDFQSIFGSGFGEVSGQPGNEEGLYAGISHDATDNLSFSAYFDRFRFPGPRFGTRSPTEGYDWLGLVEYQFSRNKEVYVLVRNRIRENDYAVQDDLGRTVYVMGEDQRGSIRTQFDYQVHPRLRLRSRVEFLRAKDAGADFETGMLLFQDFRWLATEDLRVDARITMFQTESFTSRVFQFENDLLYVMANPALFDRGQRQYILVRYQPFDFLDLYAKYGITYYENRQTVGSGLDESIGNTRSNFGVQARIQF